jgi:hypothetical protein
VADNTGQGFVIPATVQLDLGNPAEFVATVKRVAAEIQAQAKSMSVVDPSTGLKASAQQTAAEVAKFTAPLKEAARALDVAFGKGNAFATEIRKSVTEINEATREQRRPSPGAKPVAPPDKAPGPRPDKAAIRSGGVREAADASGSGAVGKKMKSSGEKLEKEIADAEDPIQRMVTGYRESAEISQRIAANEKKILDHRVRAEVAAAKAASAYAKKFIVDERDTPDKQAKVRARIQSVAQGNVDEERRRLQQRNMEVGLTRATGGDKLLALNQAAEEGLRRAVRIQQYKLDQEAGSAKAMAEEKILRERQTRAVDKEVRRQTSAADRTNIAEDNVRQKRFQIAQEKADLRAITAQDRVSRAVLDRNKRQEEVDQRLANQKAMEGKAGETLVKRQARSTANQAVLDAKQRQAYLEQFATAKPLPVDASSYQKGQARKAQERTDQLAATAVAEREQQMALRASEIRQLRDSGAAGRIGQSKALEAAFAREVSIEQTKADLAQGAATAMAKQKVLLAELNRAVSAEVRAHEDVRGIAKENLERQRQARAVRASEREQERPEDISGIARDKVDEAARRRAIAAQERAQTDVRAVAAENAAVARQRVAQQQENLRQRLPGDSANEARLAVEKRLISAEVKLAEQTEIRSAAGQKLGLQEAALAQETAQLKAIKAQMRAADQQLISAEATEARARQEQAARVTIARYGGTNKDLGLEGAELQAKAAVLKRAEADRERAAIARQTGDAERQAMAERKLEEAKLRAAIRATEKQMVKDAVKRGEVGGGGLFQQLQFAMHPSGDKLPEEYMNLRQFAGSKLTTTLGFAASGMLLGGGIAAISEMFQDATRLEQTFVRLRGQMEGLGQVEAFDEMRDQIHGIAAETGQAADKVANLVSRLVGVSGDPVRAKAEARSAAQLSTITGMDPKEFEKGLVPVAKAFSLTTQQIGDGLIDLGEKTGVPEDELLNFLSKSAVAAKNAGMSFEELKIIGGTMANALGPAFGSAGESINKVFTTINANAEKIIGVLDMAPQTRGLVDTFSQQVGSGNLSEAYFTLIRAYTQFSEQQKKAMTQNVVSRREAEDFYAVFDNGAEVLGKVDRQQELAAESEGKMAKRWTGMKDTVAITFASLAATFASLGDALFRSGLSDFLKNIGQLLQVLAGLVGVVAHAFAGFNEVAGGIPGTLLQIAAVSAVLIKSYNVLAPLISKTFGANKVEQNEETKTTGVKQRGVVATNELAASEQRLAGSKAGVAGASRTEAAALSPYAARVTGAGAVAGSIPLGTSGMRFTAANASPSALANLGSATRVGVNPAELEAQALQAEMSRGIGQNAAFMARMRGAQPAAADIFGRQAPGKFLPLKEYEIATERGIKVQESFATATSASTDATTSGAITAATLGSTQSRAADAQKAQTRATERLTRTQNAVNALSVRQAQEIKGLSRVPGLAPAQAKIDAAYEARRATQAAKLPALAEGELAARPGALMRSLSGGTVFRSAKADIGMERAGLTAGTATPLGVGLMAAAGAMVVKSAYDERQAQVVSDSDAMRERLRMMSGAGLRETRAGTQTDLLTTIGSFINRVSTPEATVAAEEKYAEATESGALGSLGIAGRQRTVQSDIDRTKQQITDKTASVSKRISERFNEESKSKIAKLFEDTPGLRGAGMELGILSPEQAGGRGPRRNKDFGAEQIAATRQWVEANRDSPDQELKEQALGVGIELNRIMNQQGGFKDLEAEGNLLASSKATVEGVEKAGSVDEYIMKTLGGVGEEQYKSIETLKRQFQNKEITQAEYIAGLKQRVQVVQTAGQQMKDTATGQTMLAQVGQIDLEIRGLEDNSLKWVDDIATQAAMLGTTRPKGTKATRHAASLAKQSIETQQAEFSTLMQEEVESWQEDAAKVFDPQARIDALNEGPKYSKVTQTNFLIKQAKESTASKDLFAKLATATGKDIATIQKEIAERAAESGKSFQDAAADYMADAIKAEAGSGNLQKQYNLIQARGEVLRGGFAEITNIPDIELTDAQRQVRSIDILANARKASARLAQAEGGPDSRRQAAIAAREAAASYRDVQGKVAVGEATEEDLKTARADMIDAQRSEGDAIFNFAQLQRQRDVIAANRDPVAENAAQMRIAEAALRRGRETGNRDAMEQAEQQILQLQQGVVENQLNIVRGAMSIQGARDSEDPYKTAINQLKAAEFELANAHGDADREQKEAAVIAAQKSLTNTISSGLTAEANLAITLANLQGDTVKATTVAANTAQRLLDEAIAKGITDSNVLAPLKAAVAETQKAKFLAPIQKQVSDFDYLYGLEQMSLGNYVALLTSERDKLVYDSQEYRDLNMKIFQLKKSAQQDLGFNLPSQIQLPTLYEARRLNQSNAMGMGYMDNRNVQLTFNVDGAQDPALVATQIMNALDGAMGGGQLYTPGISMGSVN